MDCVTIDQVAKFWESNPLCSSLIPYPLGTVEFFNYYDKLRENIESIDFSDYLHEYSKFKGKRVLDVGCGNAYVLSKYAQGGADIYGIDITQTAIDLSKKRFEFLNLKGDFKVANAEEIPFDNDFFDCVCSMGVLHHTPSVEKSIDEIYRVLKPGGRLILMLYHRNSARYLVKYSLICLFTKKTKIQLVNEYDGIGNPKGSVYSKSELRGLLNKFNSLEMFAGYLNGTSILPIIGHMIPQFILKPFERYWGWNLYVKALKPD